MRIFASTPLHVGADELARRQRRYDQICPPGVQIHLADLPEDAPDALDTADDIARSEEFVREALLAAPADYDALMADCVLDPAVRDLQAERSRRVIGILQVNLDHAAATGAPMGAVVRNEAIADEMRRVAEAYGRSAWLTDVEVMDLPYEAVTHGPDWQNHLDVAASSLARQGVKSVLNGCSAVDVDADRPTAVPVVDPVVQALDLVAAGGAR